MHQILINFGPIGLPAYGFFLGLAYIIGIHLSEKWGRDIGFNQFVILDISFFSIIGGITCSYLFGGVFSGNNHNLYPHGGRSFFGGLLGSVFVAFLSAKITKQNVLSVMDCIFLYVPLCQAVGRLGCWFYGCCHGKVCDSMNVYSICYPKILDNSGKIVGSPAFIRQLDANLIDIGFSHSLPVYPTQFMAIAMLLIIFILMRTMSNKDFFRRRTGGIFYLFFILNGFMRFIEEFYRDHYRYWNCLTNAQLVSIVSIMVGLIGLLYLVLFKRSGLN